MATDAKAHAELQQHLVNGYVKQEFSGNCNSSYPLELSNVILIFLGNILIKFDVFNDDFKRFIDENGKHIKYMISGKSLTQNLNTICCSFGMNKGVTIIDIKCINPCGSGVIGILSDIDECKTGKWIVNMSGYKYWWYNASTTIFGEKDNEDIVESFDVKESWKPNDIVRMKIDCNEWKLTFYLNEQAMHTMPLHENIKYYLFVNIRKSALKTTPTEYRLL